MTRYNVYCIFDYSTINNCDRYNVASTLNTTVDWYMTTYSPHSGFEEKKTRKKHPYEEKKTQFCRKKALFPTIIFLKS